MLLAIGVVIVLIVAAIIRSMRAPSRVNARKLGWMSEQWLAEHRATHSEMF